MASPAQRTSSGGVSMHVEPSSLNRLLGSFGQLDIETNTYLAEIINTNAHRVEGFAKSNVKVKTGRLKGSIHVIDATPDHLEAKIVADTDYAWGIEKGNPPHVIVPVNALALHFEIEGEDVFAMSVDHPGNPPMPFMEPAYKEHEEDLKANIMLALKLEFEKL
jgi:hypothetical protein